MPEPYRVNPDRDFIDRVVAAGGGDLKKCYQCATCSVVCELSDGKKPFPRKEMIWAQWGLKDRLMADPDVWICHQCNDCSTKCPRGARPGDVLAAVRKEVVHHYAVPSFLSRWANEVAFLPLFLLVSAFFLVAALGVRGPLEQALGVGPPHGFYAEFFPHWLLIGFFMLFTGLALAAAVVGIVRYWRAMSAADEAEGSNAPAQDLLTSIMSTLKAILTHDKFEKCQNQAPRRIAHLSAFYGFLALFVVTLWAVFDLYFLPLVGIETSYPFSLQHPMKLLANLGCAVLLFGCVKAIAERMNGEKGAVASTAFDWIFVWLLLSVTVTGLATEILRFAVEPVTHGSQGTNLANAALAVYFVHLVLVFQLLVYLPYSKFAHIVYRTVAMVYAEYTGRSRPWAGQYKGSAQGEAIPQ
jgi:quinone-modifying oxidoreductase subunit QmoC